MCPRIFWNRQWRAIVGVLVVWWFVMQAYVRVDRLLSAAVASEININRQSQVVHPTLFIPEGWENLGTTALSLRRNY